MPDSEEHATSPALRASDADRARVEGHLQHHYAVGRLTLSELEERVAAACEARTCDQLDALVRDLPDPQAGAEPAHARVLDDRLLIVLLCCAPPAALVYWLVCRRPSGRGDRRREG